LGNLGQPPLRLGRRRSAVTYIAHFRYGPGDEI
jgi:hypothetical protein